MKVYSFEKLECWQHARQLAVWIYNATKKFPREEKFGIIMQMRHFSTIAYGSTIELLNDLIISNDLTFLSDTFYTEGRNLIERQTLLIAQLRKSQKFNPKLS